MGGPARNSILEKLAFLGSKGPLGGSFFRLLRFFLILCFLWWGPHMNSEYIVLQNFDKKIFSTSAGPRDPKGCHFSIVKIFSNFVFFVMRTQYQHRISSFFIHLKKLDPHLKSSKKNILKNKNTPFAKTLWKVANK